MLLYMYGCVYVVLNQLFAYKYGVLVVIAFPGHEAYQYVAAKGYFAVLGACAVRQHVAYLHLVAHVHYGALVDAGALVGTLELDELIRMANAACILGHYLIGCNVDNRCILVRNYHNAGIVRSLVFHAGANHRRFWHEQRNRLALHVRSHQRAVSVVVFKEGYHCRCNGYQLLGRNVHVMHLLGRYFDYFIQPAGYDVILSEPGIALLCGNGGLVRLRNYEVVLFVRSQVYYVAADGMVLAVHLPVRRLYKAVLIDARICGKRVYKAYVRTFRGFNGAHASIMRIVNVSHVECGAVAVQTAGAECAQPALMRKLRQRVCLVHELGKLAGSEEFLYRRCNGADIYKVAGHGGFHVLYAHALAHNALKPGHTNADLVLQQLAYAPYTAVAQMVNVVRAADAVIHADKVAYAGYHIIGQDVPGYKVVNMLLQQGLELFLVHALAFLEQLHERGVMHPFVKACFFGIEAEEMLGVHEQIAKNLYALILRRDEYAAHAGVLYAFGGLRAYALAGFNYYFAGGGVYNIVCAYMSGYAGGKAQLLIELIAAYAGQVVAAVKEQCVQQAPCAFLRGGLAGTLTLVYLYKTVLNALGSILIKSVHQPFFFAHQFDYFGIGAVAQCAQQRGYVNLALAVYLNVQHFAGIGFVFQPCAAVRYYLGGIKILAQLIYAAGIIYARRTHKLADYNPFSAVYDKGALLGHEREIAHEHRLLLYFSGFLIDKPDQYLQGRAVINVPFFAFLNGVFGMVKID